MVHEVNDIDTLILTRKLNKITMTQTKTTIKCTRVHVKAPRGLEGNHESANKGDDDKIDNSNNQSC